MYTGVYISTAATTVVRTTKGLLHTIVVQGGSAGTITGYDSASAATGTPIFAFDSTSTPNTYFFDQCLNNGLVIVTSAATKLTVTVSPQSAD